MRYFLISFPPNDPLRPGIKTTVMYHTNKGMLQAMSYYRSIGVSVKELFVVPF